MSAEDFWQEDDRSFMLQGEACLEQELKHSVDVCVQVPVDVFDVLHLNKSQTLHECQVFSQNLKQDMQPQVTLKH